MVTTLENKRVVIAALCRKYGVVRVDVFGSAIRDDFRVGESGIDLLADFGVSRSLTPTSVCSTNSARFSAPGSISS